MHGWVIVSKVLLPAVVAPLVAGVGCGAGPRRLAYRVTRRTPSAQTNTGFKYGAGVHGLVGGAGPRHVRRSATMGVITLVLIAANLQAAGTGPQMWVIMIFLLWRSA